jgi:hypothetical protein
MDKAVTNATIPDLTSSAVYILLLRHTQKLNENWCYYSAQALSTDAQGNPTYFPVQVLPEYAPGCVYHIPEFASLTARLDGALASSVLNPGPTPGWMNPKTGEGLPDACGGGPVPYQSVFYKKTSYTLVPLWSKNAQACLTTRLTPTLSAQFLGSTAITASLFAQGIPLAGQVITVTVAGSTVANGVTGATGRVNIAVTPNASSAYLVSASGSPAVAPVTRVLFNDPNSPALREFAPFSAIANRYFTFQVRLSPAHATQLTLRAPGYIFTTSTAKNGVGTLRAIIKAPATTFTLTSGSPHRVLTFVVRSK